MSATGNFVITGGTTGSGGTNNFTLTSPPAAGTLIDPGIFFAGGTTGAGYATYDAGGFLRAYTSTDTNAVTEAAGTSGFTNATTSSSNVFLTGNVTNQASNLAINTLEESAANSLTINSGLTFTVDGILKTGNTAGGTITASGGTGGTGGIEPAGNSDLVIRTDQGTDSLTLTSNILASGTGALIKSGAGTLTMTNLYSNNLTGGLFLNGGTYGVSTDAALGASGDPITFNGGGLKFNTAFNPGASRAIAVNAGGGTISPTGAMAIGSNISDIGGLTINGSGTTTLGGNISGAGGITFSSTGGAALVLSGNNSFAGGIFETGSGSTNSTITLIGATAGGTGTLSTPNTAEGELTTLNLRSDSSAAFTLAGVAYNQSEDYNNSPTSATTINVGPVTNGITNQTLTLNSVTTPADESPTGSTFVLSSVAGSSYTLGINTLNLTTSDTTIVAANTAVAIGTMNFSNTNQVVAELSGTVGGTVGRIVNTFGPSEGGIYVVGGTWTFTGANSYGSGPWTSNGNYRNAGGTEISGSATTLVINNDLAVGTAPGSAQVNNIGLVSGASLEANASFTLSANRGIGIGNSLATDTGSLDVATGQTLTYNGIIANSGSTTTANLNVNSPVNTIPSNGTLILAGANTYNGATNVNGGTLMLNYALTASPLTTGTGALNVASGATLAGNGTIRGPITLNGTAALSPGFSTGIGSMALNNNPLTLLSTTTSNFNISGITGSGNNTNYTINGNQIVGVGSITYGGTLNIALAAGVSNSIFVPGSGNTYTFQLFPAGLTESGTFSSINLPNLGTSTYKWSGFDYVDGDIQIIPVVPPTQPQYTLAIAPATANAHVGALPVALTTTITNKGGLTSSDSFDFTGLGATLTGGSGGTIGGPTSGGSGNNLGYLSLASTTGLTYTNSAAGTYTLTASVGSTTGDNGTTPSLNGTPGSVTINLYSGVSNWNTGSSGNWSSYSNWDAGGAPGVYASNPTGDSATFGTQGSGPITVTVDVPVSITTLTFNTTANNYTIAAGAGSLTLNGSGAAINITGNHTIAAPVTLASNTTVTTNNSTDSLTISGAVGGSGTGSGTTLSTAGPGLIVLAANNTYTGGTSIGGGTLRIGNGGSSGTLGGGAINDNGTLAFDRSDNGQVISTSIVGSGAVNQVGTGLTTLTGANSYMGGTNINAGTLEFAQPTNVPATGIVSVASGATLAVAVGGAGPWTSTQVDALWNGTGSDSLASGAIVGIDTTGTTFTYASNITDFNGTTRMGFAALGSGTLVLSGTNTFSGGLYLNGGNVTAGSNVRIWSAQQRQHRLQRRQSVAHCQRTDDPGRAHDHDECRRHDLLFDHAIPQRHAHDCVGHRGQRRADHQPQPRRLQHRRVQRQQQRVLRRRHPHQ